MKKFLVALVMSLALMGCKKTFSDQEIVQSVEQAEKDKDPRIDALSALMEKKENIQQAVMMMGSLGLLDQKFVDELTPQVVAMSYHISKAQVAFSERDESFEGEVKQANAYADQIIDKLKVTADKFNNAQEKKLSGKQLI